MAIPRPAKPAPMTMTWCMPLAAILARQSRGQRGRLDDAGRSPDCVEVREVACAREHLRRRTGAHLHGGIHEDVPEEPLPPCRLHVRESRHLVQQRLAIVL